MKNFTIILIFFISCSNLKGQVLELDGTWRAKTTDSFNWTDSWELVFNNDSLLLVKSGPIGSWAYYDVGTFEIKKDTLVHFIGEHLMMSLNTGSSEHYKNSPMVKKYCFKFESGKLILEEIVYKMKGIQLVAYFENLNQNNIFYLEKKNDSTTISWNISNFHWVIKRDY